MTIKMEQLTTNYLTRAEMWLLITTLAYFMMNGAQLFETAAVVPKWTASPPASLAMLGGKYGLDFKVFWIVTHSLHELTFLLALVFCWKIDPVRNWLLLLFLLHVAVRIWTLIYFAPNIIDFQKIAASGTTDTDLLNRTSQWRILNYFRVGIFVAISFGLIPLYVMVMNLRIKLL
ncbi:hypothetical protein GCM10011386_34470 [Parapedobacter defluvii]|uniref:Transposase n=1 Tax=Parapedobacter defluvii TaxID=2045106 RepID=A0ABQ1MID5_9SPHI|nr:transposase [Parapedobacter defluvii]GGC39495.1 hypothetical protein GCM10011386_34470 [Parapedobacter defluvii]